VDAGRTDTRCVKVRAAGAVSCAAGVGALAAHAAAFASTGGAAARWTYGGWALASLALLVAAGTAAIRVGPGRVRTAWAMWAIAGGSSLGIALVRFAAGSTFPSLPDLLLVVPAIAGIVGTAARPDSRAAFFLIALDAVPIVSATAALVAVADWHLPAMTGEERLVALGIAVAYVFMAVVRTQMVLLTERTASWAKTVALLVGSICALGAASLVWPARAIAAGGAATGWPDLLWSAGLLALSVLGLARASRPDRYISFRPPDQDGLVRTVTPAAAVLALVAAALAMQGVDQDAVLGATAVAVAAFVARHALVRRESRRLFAALGAAEERYRSFVEQLPLVVYMGKLNASVEYESTLYVSPRVEELLGYPAEEWSADAGLFERVLHPEDREWVLAASDRHYKALEPWLLEYRLVTKDGGSVWIRDQGSIVRADDGTPVHALGFFLDITLQKEAERQAEDVARELVQTSETLLTLVGASPLPIITFDREGLVTLWNPAAERTFGWSEEEVLGRPNPLLPEVERETFARALELCRQGKSWRDVEAGRVKKDGSRIDVSISSGPLRDAAGEVVGMVAVLADVTERRRAEEELRASEERLRAYFEQASVGMAVSDANGRFLQVNPKLCEITGYSEAELLSLTYAQITHPDDVDRNVDVLGDLWAGRRPWVEFEKRYVRPDGGVVWVQVTCSVVHDAAGQPANAIAMIQDISARRLAEAQLRTAEERYRRLVEQLPLVVYIDALDETSSAIYMSPKAEEMFGYPVEEWLTDREMFPRVLHPDDRERVLRLVEADGESDDDVTFDTEYRVIAKDGRVVWVQDRAILVRDEGGKPLYAQGYMLDITGRRETEERLREAEERQRMLIEQLPAIVYACEPGPGGRWLYVSPQIESILGVSPEEWLASDGPFSSHLHPDDRERVAAEEAEGVVDGSISSEYRLVTADSRVVWFHDQAAVVRDADGRPRQLFGFMLDVTERKEADQELQLRENAMEQASSGIVIADAQAPDLPIIYANQAFARMTGYPIAQVVGRNCRFLQGPDTGQAAVEEVRVALAEGRDCNVTLLNYRRDGTPFWNELSLSPVRDAQGRTTHFVGIQTDITAIKEAEAEIQRQNERLRELDRLKDEFVALVSHELRTPLTSILGYLELVTEREAGELSEEQDRYLSVVARNAQRLQRLVGDLLLVAQIDAGRLELHPTVVDLADLAAECIEAAAPAAGEHGVRLALDAQDVPLVWGDRARLGQLLDNLISNAVKFTPGGGQVDVRVGRENGTVLLSVADTGIGIPEEERSRLFERFFRTSNATRQAIQGTGLGLAITKAIAESHGGSVQVESAEGVGSTFVVELPVETWDADDGQPTEEETP
jgi:PAS domain S-box-containing protein